MAKLASSAQRHVKEFPSPITAWNIAVQAVVTSCNISFLCHAGPIPLPFPALGGRAAGYTVLFASYLSAVAISAAMVRSLRDRLWHILYWPELSAFWVMLSSLHPAALLQIEAHLPEVGGWWWKLLLTGPLLRSLVMGGLTAWGTWKSEFPVAEELCIALLVLNGVALAELLSFVDDTSSEELLGSGIPSIADLMEVDRKLREDAEELQRCRAEKIGELQESLRRGGVEPAEVQRLIAAGYQSMDQLKELNDGDLMELGMVPRARAQFRKAMAGFVPAPDDSEAFKEELTVPSTASQVESSTAARSKRCFWDLRWKSD